MSSQLQVLKSSAGYYVGTADTDGSPIDRYSPYYSTQNEAETIYNQLELFLINDAGQLFSYALSEWIDIKEV